MTERDMNPQFTSTKKGEKRKWGKKSIFLKTEIATLYKGNQAAVSTKR